MKNIKTIFIALFLIVFYSCEDFLEKKPLSVPTTSSFLENENEMNVALNALYRSIHWDRGLIPIQQHLDLYTDIGQFRDPGIATGDFDTNNSDVQMIWTNAYITVQRANTLITGMERGKDNTDTEAYNRIQAEARVIRAWAYYHLAFMFGDVPLVTKPLEPGEYMLEETPQKEVIDFIINEIDEAAGHISWKSSERGRIGRGVALGLKARVALTDGRYEVAANAAKAVIGSGEFALNSKFQDLFTRSGQRVNEGDEIMFEFYRSDDSPKGIRNNVPLGQASRNLGGQCGKFPTQDLVDRFECIDGKRIDESAIYDPTAPSLNRDPRLKWTVVMHGDTITHYGTGATPKTCVFNIYDVATSFYNYSTGQWYTASNLDKSNPYGPVTSGVGYLWAKYTLTDEDIYEARVSWIYMRYAEILLTYAEAKIELSQIDQSVVDAINEVRNRGGMPDVDNSISNNTAKMRQLVRRERTVEMALEGFRWFDIRRWGILDIVFPGKITGASKDKNVPAELPDFKISEVTDLNDIPDYSNSENQRLTRDTRYFSPKHYLLPIPQREMDLNNNLTQNEGW